MAKIRHIPVFFLAKPPDRLLLAYTGLFLLLAVLVPAAVYGLYRIVAFKQKSNLYPAAGTGQDYGAM